MSSLEDHVRRHAGAPRPTGIPDDAVQAARAINAEIGLRVNLPHTNGETGIILAGMDAQHVPALAQVSIALSLADIAASLRLLSGREDA
jgi:hypothetical protein